MDGMHLGFIGILNGFVEILTGWGRDLLEFTRDLAKLGSDISRSGRDTSIKAINLWCHNEMKFDKSNTCCYAHIEVIWMKIIVFQYELVRITKYIAY